MQKIKIGTKEYEIKAGDYVQFNGACYMFCSGDGRTLKRKGFDSWTYISMPMTIVKKMPLNEMEKKNIQSSGINVTRWFF